MQTEFGKIVTITIEKIKEKEPDAAFGFSLCDKSDEEEFDLIEKRIYCEEEEGYIYEEKGRHLLEALKIDFDKELSFEDNLRQLKSKGEIVEYTIIPLIKSDEYVIGYEPASLGTTNQRIFLNNQIVATISKELLYKLRKNGKVRC